MNAPVQQNPICKEVVVDCPSGRFALWAPSGAMWLAKTPQEAGEAVLAILEDEAEDSVEVGTRADGGAMGRLLTEAHKTFVGPSEDAGKSKAVHVVVQSSKGPLLSLWAPDGQHVIAETAQEIGEALQGFHADESMPRCPPGAPPDPAAKSVEGLFSAGLKYLREGPGE